MRDVVTTSAVFFSYALLAVFAQNAVFTRALGVSRLVQLVGDDRTSSWLFGMQLCITQVLVTPFAWYAGSRIAPLANRAQLRPLVYIASIAVVCVLEHAVLWLAKGLPHRSALLRIVPLAGLNSCVLGTVLVERNPELYAGAEPWLWPWQRPWLCAGGAAGNGSPPPPAQQGHPGSIPRPAHHAGVYRRAGTGNLWFHRTFCDPVTLAGRRIDNGKV